MVAVPIPVVSAPGRHPHESAGRLINVYAEQLAQGARAANVWRRAPGLKQFTIANYAGWRGGLEVGNSLYAAFTGSGGRVAKYDSAGGESLQGILGGTQKVFWAHNNKAINPDIVLVDPVQGAFQVTTTPAVISYPDVNVGTPNSVCFLDGYFFFTYGDGTCIASALNDTTINPLDFVKVADNLGLLRAVPFTELYLFGTSVTEVYQDTGEPTGFPFSRVKQIPMGLLGRYCVTGYEQGFGKGVVFVANDRTVQALSGYSPAKISTPDVDRAIGNFIDGGGSVEDLEMFCYAAGGHSCVVLRSPIFTWVLDLDALRWHERKTNGINNWRAYSSVFCFDKWLAGDSLSNTIVEISENARDELGLNIPATIESGPASAFPNRIRVALTTVDIAKGVGIVTGSNPMQTDPLILISHSDDGGTSWSVPLERKIGPQADARYPVRVFRGGFTRDQGRRYRVILYDPVDFEFIGIDMKPELRTG